MKKILLSLGGLLAAVAIIGSVVFYLQKSKTPQPVVTPPPVGETEVKDVNTTGMPLKLPSGLSIEILAKNLPNARVLAFDSEGNLWVSQHSAGLITKLEIKNGKVVNQNAVFRNLRHPHGLAFDPDEPNILYVAEENKISKLRLGSEAAPEKLVDLPSDGGHRTRTIGFGPDKRLYVSIGSSCNVCREKDDRRAKIFSLNKDGSDFKEYARGLRNSVFFVWRDGQMWATEMGRDLLGDDIPPDEINIIKKGGNYGWPICYGQNIHDTAFDKNIYIRNPCMEPFEKPSLIDLQAHSAPLGLAFAPDSWAGDYQDNLFVSFHGSWNRSVPTGYKVVRYVNNNGQYEMHDFITGWQTSGVTYGRPVDIIFRDGAMYISDDKTGVIYKVTKSKKVETPPASPTPSPTSSKGACRPSGCSGEICADEEVFTTCIYREEFACYKTAQCARQSDGKCAWTLTSELLQCLGGRI